MDIPNPYLNANHKLLMAVPLVLMAISAYLILVQPGLTQGIDLKGGLLITLQTDSQVDSQAIKAALSPYSKSVEVRTVSGLGGKTGVEVELENNPALEQSEDDVRAIIELDGQLTQAELAAASSNSTNTNRVQQLSTLVLTQSQAVLNLIDSKATLPGDAHAAVKVVVEEQSAAKQRYRDTLLTQVKKVAKTSDVSFREVGSSLSRFFITETQKIVLTAFLLSAIVIFLVFRSLVPSFAVIFGAVADITMTLGAMALFGIPLSLATVATLLMLIGFSLDTDIMLTMRVLKRKEGTPEERAHESLQTGFLMNLTTIGAFSALWLISQWLQITIFEQIGLVAVIGGFADFIATWMFNASLVLWYAKKQESGK